MTFWMLQMLFSQVTFKKHRPLMYIAHGTTIIMLIHSHIFDRISPLHKAEITTVL